MTDSRGPLSLFISYSHKDDAWREKLEAHLALLKRSGVFDVWHDRRISAGREWEGEISAALEQADAILLLISADFLASDYCHDREMTRALQRHDEGSARVVPVILRACDWQAAAFGKLQALPRDGQPVDGHPDGVDRAMTQVAVALRAIAQELCAPGGAPTSHTAPAASSNPAGSPQLAIVAEPAGVLSADTTQTAATPSHAGTAEARSGRKLKFKIKIWEFDFGEFEIDWPPHVGLGSAAKALGSVVLILFVVASLGYWLMIKPTLDAWRDHMRRGEYASAVRDLESLRPEMLWLPWIASAQEQARFGARLATEPIRDLTPELDRLNARNPQHPTTDVLVFEGLRAYWVDNDPHEALQYFTRAAQHDPNHVEAHFLAAERHVDLVYSALQGGQSAEARLDAAEARRLMDAALERSPAAADLPRYVTPRADLLKLQGEFEESYQSFAKLASARPLSAVQAAMVSWHLRSAGTAPRYALDAVRVALRTLETDTKEANSSTGWSFRVGADPVILRGKTDKVCLTAWTVELSEALWLASEAALGKDARAPADGSHANPDASSAIPTRVSSGAPMACKDASDGPIRDIVCVQVLGAEQALSASDPRVKVLDAYRTTRLRCDRSLRPPPVLRNDAPGKMAGEYQLAMGGHDDPKAD